MNMYKKNLNKITLVWYIAKQVNDIFLRQWQKLQLLNPSKFLWNLN